MSRLQNKIQQCITIKTTEMLDDGNTRKANTTRVGQHIWLYIWHCSGPCSDVYHLGHSKNHWTELNWTQKAWL